MHKLTILNATMSHVSIIYDILRKEIESGEAKVDIGSYEQPLTVYVSERAMIDNLIKVFRRKYANIGKSFPKENFIISEDTQPS